MGHPCTSVEGWLGMGPCHKLQCNKAQSRVDSVHLGVTQQPKVLERVFADLHFNHGFASKAISKCLEILLLTRTMDSLQMKVWDPVKGKGRKIQALLAMLPWYPQLLDSALLLVKR